MLYRQRPTLRRITVRHQAFVQAERIRTERALIDGQWTNPRGHKKHITEAIQDGAWAGQPCFILGGGPSLKGFDFSRLKGRRTIAVNMAFFYAPEADIIFSMDYSFYLTLSKGGLGQEVKRKFTEFPGIKCWLEFSNHQFHGNIFYIKGHLHDKGLPGNLKGGYWSGANSGYGALMLAVCLKANPIYLLGYDMATGPGGISHFHGHYKRSQTAKRFSHFRVPFQKAAPALRQREIRVINLNPSSGLRCFEFGNLEDALNGQNNDAPATEPQANPSPSA